MRKQVKTALAAGALVAIGLSGCSTPPTEREVGTAVLGAVGAVGGGLLGSTIGGGAGRTAAIIGGSVLGGAIGAGVGNRLPDEPVR